MRNVWSVLLMFHLDELGCGSNWPSVYVQWLEGSVSTEDHCTSLIMEYQPKGSADRKVVEAFCLQNFGRRSLDRPTKFVRWLPGHLVAGGFRTRDQLPPTTKSIVCIFLLVVPGFLPRDVLFLFFLWPSFSIPHPVLICSFTIRVRPFIYVFYFSSGRSRSFTLARLFPQACRSFFPAPSLKLRCLCNQTP